MSPILRDRAIDDCTAIEALPEMEDQEEIREAFERQEAIALRTVHQVPGRTVRVVYLVTGMSEYASQV